MNRDHGEEYEYVAELVGSSTIPALRPDEIDIASKNDTELVELRQCIQTDDWSNCSCKEYLPVRQELCNHGNLLLRELASSFPNNCKSECWNSRMRVIREL